MNVFLFDFFSYSLNNFDNFSEIFCQIFNFFFLGNGTKIQFQFPPRNANNFGRRKLRLGRSQVRLSTNFFHRFCPQIFVYRFCQQFLLSTDFAYSFLSTDLPYRPPRSAPSVQRKKQNRKISILIYFIFSSLLNMKKIDKSIFLFHFPRKYILFFFGEVPAFFQPKILPHQKIRYRFLAPSWSC